MLLVTMFFQFDFYAKRLNLVKSVELVLTGFC